MSDLFEVSLERHKLVWDVVVRHVEVVADLLADGDQEGLEGGAVRRGAQHSGPNCHRLEQDQKLSGCDI